MNVLFYVDEPAVHAWCRAYIPATEISRQGHHALVESNLVDAIMEWCDVLVVLGGYEQLAMPAVQYANSIGKLTVCDLCDDIWRPHAENPRTAVWLQQGMREQAEAILGSCDLVTTGRACLLPSLKRLNRRVTHIPDALPDELWPFERVEPEGRVVVGWSHRDPSKADASLIEQTISRLMFERPRFEFRTYGPSMPAFAMGVSDDELMLRARTRAVSPASDMASHVATLSGFHVGLAPCGDTAYERGLSDAPILEYAAAGVPCVASKVDGYADAPALLAGNAKDWLRITRRLIDDADYRQDAAEKALAGARRRVVSKSEWVRSLETAAREKGTTRVR